MDVREFQNKKQKKNKKSKKKTKAERWMRMMLNDDDDDDDNMSLHVFPILTAVLGSRGVSVEEIDRLPRKNKYKKKIP